MVKSVSCITPQYHPLICDSPFVSTGVHRAVTGAGSSFQTLKGGYADLICSTIQEWRNLIPALFKISPLYTLTVLYWIFQGTEKKKKKMENRWMSGQRSTVQRCSLGPAVQTEKSLDSDASLSQREGVGVSGDINPPPLTSAPQFQPRCLPSFGVKEGPLGEEAGASSSGRAHWKSHHTVTFELEWVRHGCDIPHVYSCREGSTKKNVWRSKSCPQRDGWGIFGFFNCCAWIKSLRRPHV